MTDAAGADPSTRPVTEDGGASVARTAEQIEADKALTAAIERALLAYADDGTAWVATEYVVVTSQQRFDDDGESLTAVGTLYRDGGEVPIHRALGLIEYAATRMRKHIAEDEEDLPSP